MELIREARRVLAQHEPILARTLSDAILAAWLGGAQQAVAGLPVEVTSPTAPTTPDFFTLVTSGQMPALQEFLSPDFTPPLLPPPPTVPFDFPEPDEEPVVEFPQVRAAAENLASRRLLTRDEFDRLDAAARETAFTVARVASLDALEKIQAALVEDIRTGGTLREFEERVDVALGSSAIGRPAIENVYRTTIGQVYKAGQQQILDHPLVSDEFPYVAYEGIEDRRRRKTHAWFATHGLNGTNVYRRDDPTILRFWAPWDYQCRCGMVPLTIEDAARRGVREAAEWLATGIPPVKPTWVTPPDFSPPPGFDVAMRV